MTKILIYQIGYGQWGAIAFEKFLELKNEISEMEIGGVCDIKTERRVAAEDFAKEIGLKIKSFALSFDMYRDAIERQKQGSIILIYDAGPSELLAAHLIKSMEHGFFHVAEKPPYTNRKEKKEIDLLVKKQGGRWTVDLIEDESPVVKTALEYAKADKIKIKRMEAYRYNSMALKKLALEEHRLGVTGGDLLDKMLHEAYLSRFLDGYNGFSLKKAKYDYLMISSLEKPEIIDVHGKVLEKEEAATAQSSVEGIFKSKTAKIPFFLGSGWLGVPEYVRKKISRMEKQIGTNLIFSQEASAGGNKFCDEELRLFIIEGFMRKRKVALCGDMKHKRLFLKEGGKWKRLDLMNPESDQLYRVLKNAVLTAQGKEGFGITRKEVDFIMDITLGAREKALKGKINLKKEAEKTKEYIMNKIETT